MTLSKDKLDLPWTVGEHGLQIRDINDRRVIDQVDDWDRYDFVALCPEQADYIVRAVNNHEALVAALRTALGATDEDRTPQADDDLQAARKLLASLE